MHFFGNGLSKAEADGQKFMRRTDAKPPVCLGGERGPFLDIGVHAVQEPCMSCTHYCGVGVHYFTPLVGWALDGLGREESSQTIIKRFLVLLTAAFFFFDGGSRLSLKRISFLLI